MDEKSEQQIREQNITAIVDYFESGIKSTASKVGIELEHILVTDECRPVSYSEHQGVKWLLEQLLKDYPEASYDDHGDLLGLSRSCEAITLEPAAQVELSAGPYADLHQAQKTFEAFEQQLADILGPVGKRVLTLGYHPSTKVADLELIPKRRYKFMNLYLSNVSKYGPYMMRGSASTQIAIDYTSVDDCLRKLRLANALVPIISLITDNTPYFEGAPRPHGLMRTEIWQYCDPDRCGLVSGVMDKGFTLRDYAEYVMRTPAILVPCKLHEWCYAEETFEDIYRKKTMGLPEVEHALSMLFNDVRLKTYIEIRPGDAMPLPYVIAYAAFIKGLFYCAENLDFMDELFANVGSADVNEAKGALMASEYDAEVYGRPVADLASDLMAAARCGLNENERALLDPLAHLVNERTTLAQLSLKFNEKF